jgi:ribosome-associated protein
LQQIPNDIVRASIPLIQSKKGRDIAILDLRGITDVADYFVLCTADSDIQAKAISDALVEGMKIQGHRPWHTEGYESRKWVLIDFVDVVIHIFQQESRKFYGLERLWGDAPRITMDEDGRDEEGIDIRASNTLPYDRIGAIREESG